MVAHGAHLSPVWEPATNFLLLTCTNSDHLIFFPRWPLTPESFLVFVEECNSESNTLLIPVKPELSGLVTFVLFVLPLASMREVALEKSPSIGFQCVFAIEAIKRSN